MLQPAYPDSNTRMWATTVNGGARRNRLHANEKGEPMFRPASLAAIAVFALGACTSGHTPEREPDRQFHPPDELPPDELPETNDPIGPTSPPVGNAGIARTQCGYGTTPFRMLSAAARDDAFLGSCGELAWRDAETGALYLAGSTAEPRKVADAGWPLWLAGDQLLYAGSEGVVLEAGGEAKHTWQVSGLYRAGKVPGREAFWTCSLERGLERLDDEGVTALSPDFLHTEYDEGCLSIDVAATGAIAYATQDHRLGLVDPATGEKQVLDHPFFPQESTDADGEYRLDLVRLSPDAALVLHEKRWLASSGDAIYPTGEGEVTVVPADGSQPLRLSGTLGDGWSFGGTAGWFWYGPWMATAPGVLLPGEGTSANLIGLGAPIAFGELQPRALRGNHLFAETAQGAALLELGNGTLHPLLDAPSVEAVVPFRWGGPVAFSHFTSGCIRWPDRPEYCHTQLWALTLWDEARGARQVALGTQPLHVQAIAPDGRMIVAGRMLDAPPPAIEEPRDVAWRVLLLDPAGKLVREIDRGESIEGGLGGENFALLERSRRDGDKRTEELVAIDWSTGEETVLVSGRYVDAWALDDGDRRVTALVTPMGDSSVTQQLWSGVPTLKGAQRRAADRQ